MDQSRAVGNWMMFRFPRFPEQDSLLGFFLFVGSQGFSVERFPGPGRWWGGSGIVRVSNG